MAKMPQYITTNVLLKTNDWERNMILIAYDGSADAPM